MDRPFHNTPKLQNTTCQACGGTWFREATIRSFAADPSMLGLPSPDCGPGQGSKMPMTILICLCGAPFCMRPIGERGNTAKAELAQYSRSSDCVKSYENSRNDGPGLEQKVVPRMVTKERLQELRRALVELEKSTGRMLANQGRERDKRGRHWRLPERNPATQSKGRSWLTLQLQNCGFTFDESRNIVTAIFDAMTDALKAGEAVATPIGNFQIRKRTKPYRRFRFGKLQRVHQRRNRVVFDPRSSLSDPSAIAADKRKRNQ
jgi:nucleoid DNA-binding protein